MDNAASEDNCGLETFTKQENELRPRPRLIESREGAEEDVAPALRDLPGQKKIKIVETTSTECGRESTSLVKFALGVDEITKESIETEEKEFMLESVSSAERRQMSRKKRDHGCEL